MRFLPLALLVVAASAVQITVPPHEDECFYHHVDSGNKLTGTYEVIAGGLLDVDVTVFGPHGDAQYAVQRQKQGSYTVMAHVTGLYRVCFSNRMSTLTEKTVAFSVHTGDALYQEVAKQEHITPLEMEVTQLADAITVLEDEQRYMWARERAARDTNESTNTRVMWFNIMEAVVVFVLAGVQVYFLTSFFDSRSFRG